MNVANLHVHVPVGLADIGNFVPCVNKKVGILATNEGLSPRNNFFMLKRLMSPILSIFWHLVTQCLYFFLPVHYSKVFGSIL